MCLKTGILTSISHLKSSHLQRGLKSKRGFRLGRNHWRYVRKCVTQLTLERSSLPLPHLTKPLRPFFIHPSTSLPPFIPETPNYIPIICLSASRWVNEGRDEIPSVTNIGQRKVGFEYVPGGGDDDELWARVSLFNLRLHCC